MLTLIGPPGTGKSDTIRWLADTTARMLRTSGNALAVNAVALFDENLGKSPKLVKELFADITLSASRRLTFVLIDDAETIFLARQTALAKNGDPSDVAKATTEFLHGLDDLRFGNVIILTTLNLDGVVDFAVEDRSDLILRFALPSYEQRLAILRKVLKGLVSERVLVTLAKATEGWSGRRLSKLEMLAYIKGTAKELEALTPENFLSAVGPMSGCDVGSDEQTTPEMQEEDECTTRSSLNKFLAVITPRKSRWS
jgi:AAA+ superfamily predicted ATPase